MPISEKHLEYAATVKAKLEAAGLRVELEQRNEKMNAKIREFTLQKVPFVLVMGDKEAAAEAVSVGRAERATRGAFRSPTLSNEPGDWFPRRRLHSKSALRS